MLSTAASRLLPAAHKAAGAAIATANDAGGQWDVLTAESVSQAAQAAAEAERAGLKVKASDLALRLIVAKLEGIPQGGGNLEDLLKVVSALDPAGRAGGGGSVVAVQVIVSDERGG